MLLCGTLTASLRLVAYTDGNMVDGVTSPIWEIAGAQSSANTQGHLAGLIIPKQFNSGRRAAYTVSGSDFFAVSRFRGDRDDKPDV